MKIGLKNNKEAVSAIITFVLLTTVALIFIGNWLNVAVPEWGAEEEERHLVDVQNSLVGVRASSKALIYSGNTDFVIPNYIKLGTPGEAWKGVGRANGELIFNPLESSILFKNSTSNLVATKGNLEYNSNNLYFPDQDVIFESGAIIKDQTGKSALVAPPEFHASIDGSQISISMTLISFTGDKDILSGNLGVIVYTRLASRESNWYNWTTSNEELIIHITTQYPGAWGTYYETTLTKQGFREVPAAATPNQDGEFKVVTTGNDCTVTIANVDWLESTVAAVDIWFG